MLLNIYHKQVCIVSLTKLFKFVEIHNQRENALELPSEPDWLNKINLKKMKKIPWRSNIFFIFYRFIYI